MAYICPNSIANNTQNNTDQGTFEAKNKVLVFDDRLRIIDSKISL